MIEKQKELLSEGIQNILQGNHKSLLASYWAFVSEVAFSAFQKSNISLSWVKFVKQFTFDWTYFKAHVEKESRKEFSERQAQLNSMSEKK